MENETKYSKNSKTDVIKQFCAHLGKGFSKECFVDFDYTEVHKMAEELDEQNNNTEFTDMIERGYRAYKYFWEEQGINNMNIETASDSDGNKIIKFDRRIWMFMYKLKREINSGQAEIPFEGVNVVRLKSNS
jgi:hypothetical protein